MKQEVSEEWGEGVNEMCVCEYVEKGTTMCRALLRGQRLEKPADAGRENIVRHRQ